MGAVWYWHRHPEIERIDENKKVKVGQKIPSFGASTSRTKINLAPGVPKGKFHFYLASKEEIPEIICLDFECGDEAADIVKYGGHLVGSMDFKGAKVFGIDLIHNGEGWEQEYSLLIITDENAVVEAMYKHARLEDVPKLLEEYLNGREDFLRSEDPRNDYVE